MRWLLLVAISAVVGSSPDASGRFAQHGLPDQVKVDTAYV